jgi:hypothetical protein
MKMASLNGVLLPIEGDSRMKIQDFVSLVLVEYPSVVDDGNVDDD